MIETSNLQVLVQPHSSMSTFNTSACTNRDSVESATSVTHLFSPKHTRDVLPTLDYSLGDRKLAVFICWTVIFFDSSASAIILYYPLTYSTSLAPWQGTYSADKLELHLTKCTSDDDSDMFGWHNHIDSILLESLDSC